MPTPTDAELDELSAEAWRLAREWVDRKQFYIHKRADVARLYAYAAGRFTEDEAKIQLLFDGILNAIASSDELQKVRWGARGRPKTLFPALDLRSNTAYLKWLKARAISKAKEALREDQSVRTVVANARSEQTDRQRKSANVDGQKSFGNCPALQSPVDWSPVDDIAEENDDPLYAPPTLVRHLMVQATPHEREFMEQYLAAAAIDERCDARTLGNAIWAELLRG